MNLRNLWSWLKAEFMEAIKHLSRNPYSGDRIYEGHAPGGGIHG